jgi:hypothetical protein
MGGGRRHELKLMKQRSMSRSGSVLIGVEKARCERGLNASKTFHVRNFGLYVCMFCVYMQTYRSGNFEFYMLTHRHKTEKRIELVVTFYVYMRICAKKSHFTYFWVKRETHPKFMRTQTFAMWHT